MLILTVGAGGGGWDTNGGKDGGTIAAGVIAVGAIGEGDNGGDSGDEFPDGTAAVSRSTGRMISTSVECPSRPGGPGIGEAAGGCITVTVSVCSQFTIRSAAGRAGELGGWGTGGLGGWAGVSG